MKTIGNNVKNLTRSIKKHTSQIPLQDKTVEVAKKEETESKQIIDSVTQATQVESSKTLINVTGYRLDTIIRELELEINIAMNRLDSFQEKNNFPSTSDVIVKLFHMITILNQKLAKWNEIRNIYDMNINLNIMNQTITLYEAKESFRLLTIKQNKMQEVLSFLSKNDKYSELQNLFIETKKQQRLIDMYEEGILKSKMQNGSFEIESILLQHLKI